MTLDPQTAHASKKLKKFMKMIAQRREQFAGASQEFRNRYFIWCLEESKSEVDRDFKFVRLVQDRSTSIFFDFIASLPHDERKEVLVSFFKAMHCSDSLSSKEAETYRRYRQHWSMPVVVGGQDVSELRSTPRQLAMQERFLKQSSSARIVSRALRTGLKSTLVPEFGRILLDKPSLLAYEKSFGPWYVVTNFEFGRHWQLRYSHNIHAAPGGELGTKIFSDISILSWTGIHPESTWSWLLPEDVDGTVKAVQQICTHFMKQAESLLANLPR